MASYKQTTTISFTKVYQCNLANPFKEVSADE